MKRFSLAIFAIAALLAGVVAADAQGRHGDRERDRDRDRGRHYSKADVERIIQYVEQRSDLFRKHVDRQLDRSRMNGSRTEDRINAEVKQFENAVDQLRGEFNRRDSWRDARVNVEKVLRSSNDVNAVMRRAKLGDSLEREWDTLRGQLNTLANVYDLPPLRG